MKNSKLRRILLLLACAVLLVSLSVGATLAYLTSTTETVQNTFTVGKVEIILDEKNTDGKDKNGKDNKDQARDDGNEYHLLPGGIYEKDPTVTVVGGSEACYVRMIVTIGNFDKLKAVYGDDVLPQELVNDTWDKTNWPCVGMIEDGNTVICEFRYNGIVAKSETDTKLPALFTHIKVDGEKVTEKNIENLKAVTIDVKAHAIQSDSFNNDADAAWEAYDGQNP